MDGCSQTAADIVRRLRADVAAAPTVTMSGTTLATHLRMPLAELRLAVAEHTGLTPEQFVRHYRLDAVHRELSTEGASITASARAWGFVHLARFTAAYVDRFGQSPAETQAAAISNKRS